MTQLNTSQAVVQWAAWCTEKKYEVRQAWSPHETTTLVLEVLKSTGSGLARSSSIVATVLVAPWVKDIAIEAAKALGCEVK